MRLVWIAMVLIALGAASVGYHLRTEGGTEIVARQATLPPTLAVLAIAAGVAFLVASHKTGML